jgi:hypothetical protein
MPMVLPPACPVHEKAHAALPQWCDSLAESVVFPDPADLDPMIIRSRTVFLQRISNLEAFS